MKLRLLDMLLCPECQGALSLKVYCWKRVRLAPNTLDQRAVGQMCSRWCAYESGDTIGLETESHPNCSECHTLEVLEGDLTCKVCGSNYPIIKGVPRMLVPSCLPLLMRDYPQFFQRYATSAHAENLDQIAVTRDNVLDEKLKTARSFGYQWTTFSTMYQEWRYNFLEYIHPLQPDFFIGKLVLDAGCGIGHHAHWSSCFGAETVAVDLSRAVDSAWENNHDMPTVHVVQADIYRLPFTAESFDFIYSVGVLHHLPNPEVGFQTLLDYLKPRGTIFAWVYGKRKGVLPQIATALRFMTPKLPFPLLKAACYVLAVGLCLGFHIPYRILSRWEATKWLADVIPTTELSKYPFRVVVTNIFDTLSVPIIHYSSEESFRRWFEHADLENVRIIERNTMFTSWRGIGTKRASPAGT
jgi:SAM-dependent methyltransferase/uncharacterized protein YbaR (Trm112 family)